MVIGMQYIVSSKYRKRLLIVIVSFLLIAFCLPPVDALAKSSHEDLKEAQKEIGAQKERLQYIKKTELSVLRHLGQIDADLNKIKRQLIFQGDEINRLQGNISALQDDINIRKKELQAQGDILKERLRALQRVNRESDAILMLISGYDISQTLRILRNINDIVVHDRAIIEKYVAAVDGLREKQRELERLSVGLKAENKKSARVEKSLKEKKRERISFLIRIKKEKISHEREIRRLAKVSNRILRIIQESERQQRILREKARRALQYRDFVLLKGRLPLPVTGPVVLGFGKQVDPLFNLPKFRSGVHIRASSGSPVKVVHRGKVVFADAFGGFDNLVIISHGGGYHTIYGNLSRIFVRVGDIVDKRKVIGEVGKSSALGTSGLYFEVRHKGSPMDPQQWLKR